MVVCDTCFTMHDRHVKAVWRVRVNVRRADEGPRVTVTREEGDD